ncbi:MAG: glycosyltransferase family 2 protein [Bacteroidales bacterium]|nr:glycosyltransferase family 2 protein [Bacteroidales bacterium]
MTDVSIIIPVYNAAPFLRECIDSVLAQTYTAWELILVDDASTDGSADICRQYAARDERVRLISADRGEVSATRNKGIDAARGRYIMFVDADDALTPDALALLRAHAGQADVVVGQFVYSPENTLAAASRGADAVETVAPVEAIIRTLYQDPEFHNSPWAKLYARHIFDGERFVKGRKYEDLESFLRFYLRANCIAVLKKKIYWYRESPGSFINSLSPARADALWAVDSLLSQAQALGPEVVKAARSRRFSAYCNIFGIAIKTGNVALAQRCFNVIKEERRAILTDPRVRLKNKLAAALSYLGYRAMKATFSRVY